MEQNGDLLNKWEKMLGLIKFEYWVSMCCVCDAT